MRYRTLGKSGLKVTEFALGAMTFGWGADKQASRRIFDTYRDAGGNFFDTADRYTGGQSEEFLGEFVKDAGIRDQAVIATKFSFNQQQGNPNTGGNGRKNIRRALEASLKRLNTDYVDLYILHAWDRVTPVEEVMMTLNDLVREGKVLHLGMSDAPAWYVSRAQTFAQARNLEPLISLQFEYSLVSRNIEREHIPLALETGMAITPWSPLAGGLLSGKYRKVNGEITGEGRVFATKDSGNPILEKVSKDERHWAVVETLVEVAREMGRAPAEVALAWVLSRPGVGSVLIGATRVEQLQANLKAREVTIPPPLMQKLNDASALRPTELDHFFGEVMQGMIHGGVAVETMRVGYAGRV